MKILKSGIEMTPEELQATIGGTCACSCQLGYNSGQLNVSGHEGGDCVCGCTREGGFMGAAGSAYRRV